MLQGGVESETVFLKSYSRRFLLNFYSVFESELAEAIPIVRSSIAGTRIIGRMCVGALAASHYIDYASQRRRTGNKNGLLLPSTTTDQELVHLRNSLPDDVAVQRIDERAHVLLTPRSARAICPALILPAVVSSGRVVRARKLHRDERLRGAGTHGYR